MKAKLLMLLALTVSGSVLAHGHLGDTMDGMKDAFKQAIKADSVPAMQSALTDFKTLVNKAKSQGHDLSAAKQRDYDEGLNKLTAAVESVEATLAKGDLDAARKELKSIDSLRREYHKKTR
jgi:soluble cytochrome b562